MSRVTSLFSAVLIFHAFKDVMVEQFGETGGHDGAPPDIKSLCIAFLRLFIMFWVVQACLMKWRRSELPLYAWAQVGGVCVAFAAIDAFGMVQQFEPFRNNPGQ